MEQKTQEQMILVTTEEMSSTMGNLLIENETPMTKATVKEYVKPIKTLGILMLSLGVLLGVLNRFGVIMEELFFICAAFSFLGMFVGLVLCLLAWKHVKNPTFKDGVKNVYSFYENGIIIRGFDETQKSVGEIAFEEITKITDSGCFYIINIGQIAYLVDDRKFTVGDAVQFRKLLQEKCNLKMIKLREKRHHL